jgi:hypothetical protein
VKASLAVGWILTLLAAFGVGRSIAPGASPLTASPLTASPSLSVALASLSRALDESDYLSHRYQIAKYFQGLGSENLDETVALLEKRRSQISEDDAQVFLMAWCGFDPAAAFAWASGAQRRWAMGLEGAAIYGWAYHDPAGALGAVENAQRQRQDGLRQKLIMGWINGGDSEGATAFIYTLPRTPRRMVFVDWVLAEVGRGGVEAVKAWAKTVPEEHREPAYLRAAGFLTKTDPAEAVKWYATIQEEKWASGALGSIARMWLDTNEPATLFDWLAQLPDDDERNEIIRMSFIRWRGTDPEEAIAWLTSVELVPAFDTPIAVHARQLSRSDPAAAVDWADRIQTPNLRKKSLLPILRAWNKTEPKAARDWLMENEKDLPEELRKLILERPGKQT